MVESLTTNGNNTNGQGNVQITNGNSPPPSTNSTAGNLTSVPGPTATNFPKATTNPLNKWSSYNCLFTLACISKSQQNSGNFSSSNITNVLASSKGDWGKNNRTNTIFGQYDYFIDDVIILSRPAPVAETGMTFATKITFKVIEPYSMGLFLVAMQEGAAAGGYGQFREASYLFVIEFAGYDDAGTPSLDSGLTRYIPILITNIQFKVTAAGSVYEVEARPYNHLAHSDQQTKITKDTILRGKKVYDLLAGGTDSLLSELNKQSQQLIQDGVVTATDKYEIHFPSSWEDAGNSGNPIMESELFKDLNDNGTVPFPTQNNDTIFNSVRQIYRPNQIRVTPDKNIVFSQNTKIEDIITEVILRSDYIVNQLLNGRLLTDPRGMVKWFRIEARIEDLEDVPGLGRQIRRIIYRVVPYDVHVDRFVPPNTRPPGYEQLAAECCRVYKYIYSGENTEIINLDIEFKFAFRATLPADATGRTAQNNSNQGGAGAGGRPITNAINTPSVQEDLRGAEISTTPSAGETARGTDSGGSGSDSEQTRKVKVMNSLLTAEGDMQQIKLQIRGDPYWIPSSGNGNIIIPSTSSNMLTDGSANYQSGQTDFFISFRTPVDLDPESGLYKFERSVDTWSGIYMLIEVESKFEHGKFTQTLDARKRRAQVAQTPATQPALSNTSG